MVIRINEDDCNTKALIVLAKANIKQLLEIGMVNSDEKIKETFDGEKGLLSIIKGYVTLLEDLIAIDERERGISEYKRERIEF